MVLKGYLWERIRQRLGTLGVGNVLRALVRPFRGL